MGTIKLPEEMNIETIYEEPKNSEDGAAVRLRSSLASIESLIATVANTRKKRPRMFYFVRDVILPPLFLVAISFFFGYFIASAESHGKIFMIFFNKLRLTRSIFILFRQDNKYQRRGCRRKVRIW